MNKFLLSVALLSSALGYSQTVNLAKAGSIIDYVDSVKTVDLVRGSHEHFSFHRYRKNRRIRMGNNIGGTYLEVFNFSNEKIALIEYTGGIDKLYFYEKFYYRNDSLVYCEIKENTWSKQEKIWEASLIIMNDTVLLRDSINYSKKEISYIKQFKYRRDQLVRQLAENNFLRD